VVFTSNRRSRVVHRHAAALIAITALVAQVFFPHVHASQPTAGRASTAVGRCVADGATVIGAAGRRSDRDADRHSPASCPLCRAQSDARASTLPAGFVLPIVTAGHAASLGVSATPPTAVFLGLASPRAPPVVS
jgi:hypothetical protein